MARTTTAAPAPGNRRNGKVQTIVVDPSILTDATSAELSAPVLPAKFAAAAAKLAETPKPVTRREAARRVTLTPDELRSFQALGWNPPKVTAFNVWRPRNTERSNTCKAELVYDLLGPVLASGDAISLGELANLWIAVIGAPEAGKKVSLSAILQTTANRHKFAITQIGDIFATEEAIKEYATSKAT